MNKKILRNLIASSLAIGVINFSPIILHENNLQIVSVAYAKVENITAVGRAEFNFGENNPQLVEMAKNYARMNAVQAAKEKAGVYLKSFSRTVNGVLTDDDISVVASNTAEIIDVQYKKVPYASIDMRGNATGEIGIAYEATVIVKIDSDELSKYIKRDEKEKSTLIEQNKSSQKNIADINKQVEELKNNSQKATATEVQKIDNKILAQQKLDEANRLYYLKKYNQAVELLNESLKFVPNNKDSLHALGNIFYLNLTDRTKALSYYKKVVEIDPYEIEVWHMMSLIYQYHLKDEKQTLECIDKAVENGNKILSKNPNDVKTLIILGGIYSLSDTKKALEYYDRAVNVAPDDKLAWISLGNFYNGFNVKNTSKAIECFEKALSIDPNYLPAWDNLGIVYTFRLKNYEKAIEYYEKTLSIDPDYYNAYKNLGYVYKSMKNYNKSVEYYEKAVKVAPEDKSAWESLAKVYSDDLKNYAKAVESYERALKIAPKDAFMWTRIAWLYFHEMKNYQKAVECYTKAIEINPKDEIAYQMRGLCYKELGQTEKAEKDFAKARQLGWKG